MQSEKNLKINDGYCFIFRSISHNSQSLARFSVIVDSRDIHFHISRDIFMSIYARKNRTAHFALATRGRRSFLRLHDINRVNPQSTRPRVA